MIGAQAAATAPLTGHDIRLMAVLLGGIVFVAVAVSALKLHPVLALLSGGVLVGLAAGLGVTGTVEGLTTGIGKTLGETGVLIALGAMFGAVLSESGAASRIVQTLTGGVGVRGLPWVVLAASVLIGLPMFFEVGFVTLIPVVLLLARRTGIELTLLAFPLLAGLDAAQCLLPPHPGPVGAAGALGSSIGLVLVLGLVVAAPAVLLTGPWLGRLMRRWVRARPPAGLERLFAADGSDVPRPPGRARSFAVILLPVLLMLGKAATDLFWADGTGPVHAVVELAGEPAIALLISVLVAVVVLGGLSGTPREVRERWVGSSLAPIAGITFIVGAAGGFSRVIVESGTADAVLDLASGAGVPTLLLTFGIAAILVAALGSATVAGVLAATLVAPSVGALDPVHLALLVLAAGAGSSFLLHVNSAGFWLSKEYFGLTVGENLRVWTLSHTVLSVTSMAGVSLLWVLL
ncbi:GntP family permease [Saccharopolyspora sp. 6M]|uniref:GntP family permease n=1 Tax=Saccharopolyspora sp. 6M TaxID=2877237 RepID=UPI001CD6244C|nr:gluconate:H+ symporter [Saccharopolyspora sp. 6M]MCA1226483.1 GntP family permease [Saccharopolyspora sp. 6M]